MKSCALNAESASKRSEGKPDVPTEAAQWLRARRSVGMGYFWFYAAIGALMPFIALYYRELGFSGVQVGVLTALPSLGMALFGPLWGAVSDSLAIHRWVLCGSLALAGVIAFSTSQATAFAPMLVLIGLLAFASVPVAPLLDSYGMTVGDRTERSYGSLRVWGSVGYMASVLIVGRLMGDDVSALLLVAHGGFLALALLSVRRLPALGERRAMPLLGGLRAIAGNRPIILLLLAAYLISSGAAVMNIYLGIHIEDIGGTATLIGLAFAVSAASELPIIAFGGWFLRRLGAVRLVALAISVYAVRFAGFSVITAPEWLLPIQSLHGLSYGAFLMASVTLAHRLAGREHAATAQALLTAMSFGFGSITGSIVGGALLDQVGTAGLFQGAAVLMAITLAVLLVSDRTVGIGRHGAPQTEAAT
jgi:PPP family 3-phenylpropionic acid transporter